MNKFIKKSVVGLTTAAMLITATPLPSMADEVGTKLEGYSETQNALEREQNFTYFVWKADKLLFTNWVVSSLTGNSLVTLQSDIDAVLVYHKGFEETSLSKEKYDMLMSLKAEVEEKISEEVTDALSSTLTELANSDTVYPDQNKINQLEELDDKVDEVEDIYGVTTETTEAHESIKKAIEETKLAIEEAEKANAEKAKAKEVADYLESMEVQRNAVYEVYKDNGDSVAYVNTIQDLLEQVNAFKDAHSDYATIDTLDVLVEELESEVRNTLFEVEDIWDELDEVFHDIEDYYEEVELEDIDTGKLDKFKELIKEKYDNFKEVVDKYSNDSLINSYLRDAVDSSIGETETKVDTYNAMIDNTKDAIEKLRIKGLHEDITEALNNAVAIEDLEERLSVLVDVKVLVLETMRDEHTNYPTEFDADYDKVIVAIEETRDAITAKVEEEALAKIIKKLNTALDDTEGVTDLDQKSQELDVVKEQVDALLYKFGNGNEDLNALNARVLKMIQDNNNESVKNKIESEINKINNKLADINQLEDLEDKDAQLKDVRIDVADLLYTYGIDNEALNSLLNKVDELIANNKEAIREAKEKEELVIEEPVEEDEEKEEESTEEESTEEESTEEETKEEEPLEEEKEVVTEDDEDVVVVTPPAPEPVIEDKGVFGGDNMHPTQLDATHWSYIAPSDEAFFKVNQEFDKGFTCDRWETPVKAEDEYVNMDDLSTETVIVNATKY